MNFKHICVVTGTRAEYGPLKLVIKKIINSKKLKLSLFVTGMHLLKKYGYTIDIIKNDGFPIAKVIPMYDEEEKGDKSLGNAVGKAIVNLSKALEVFKPDLLLVAGDRFESLAAVVAASTLSIPIAHIQGGDSADKGQIDEQIRHAITKFVHVHFPATQQSAQRIKLMGEEEWRIHVFGAIALDMIYQEKILKKSEICEKLGLNPFEKIIVCILHPYIYQSDLAGEQMRLVIQVCKDLNLYTVMIYPNNDPGNELIINEIEKCKTFSNFKIFKNLERIDFLSILKNADLLIGNSSAGFIESPAFHIPVVNIGDRNKGREHADNIIDVPYDYLKIHDAVLKGLSKNFKEKCKNIENPYGDGKASERIIKYLENLNIEREKLLIKKLTYKI